MAPVAAEANRGEGGQPGPRRTRPVTKKASKPKRKAAPTALALKGKPKTAATTALATVPPPVKLTPKEQERIDAYKAQRAELVLPKFKAGETENAIVVTRDSELTDAVVTKAVGIADATLAYTMLDQVTRSIAPYTGETAADRMNRALAAMTGLDPKDPLEGMLAGQMVAAHNLAMTFASRATSSGDPSGISLNVDRATKMMRTFTAQIEALNRYRGKGQQRVVVEHVTVNAGGQAVVGNVAAGPAPSLTATPQPQAALAAAPGPEASLDTIVRDAVVEHVGGGRGSKGGNHV